MTDRAFEEWKQRARDHDLLEAATTFGGAKLKKHGVEWVGPCPACGGTDRFSVKTSSPPKWNCRSATKPEQSGIGILMHCQPKLEFMEACEMLAGPPPRSNGSNGDARLREPDSEAEDEALDRRKEKDREDKAEERAAKQKKSSAAEKFFETGIDIQGTLTVRYLAGRKISLSAAQAVDVRHIDGLKYKGYADPQAEEETDLGHFPAMLAAIRTPDGALIGVHWTYLDPKTGKKLTPPGDTARNKSKKMWGVAMGGSILLGAVRPIMAIGEGIETSESWYELGLVEEDCGVAAAASLGNLSGAAMESKRFTARDPKSHREISSYVAPNGKPDPARPGMLLWEEVEEVILLGDHDWGFDYLPAWKVEQKKRITVGHLLTAARRWRAAGKKVSVHMAPEGMDWSDVRQQDDDNVKIPPIMGFDEFEAWGETVLTPPFHSLFGAMYLDQLDDAGEEHDYLIEGFFTRGEKSVIAGESQSGKSFLAIDAAMRIATKLNFFGANVKKGLVIYQAGEGAKGIKKRLRAWRKHFGVKFSREVPFVLLRSKIDIYGADGDTAKFIDEIKAIAAQYDCPLQAVFIDTLATAQGAADENSGKDMGAVMSNIDRINRETGAHVCLVHHLNKQGGKLRGHSSLYANVDQVILVTKGEDGVRTVRLDKQKDDESGLEFKFELLSIHLGESDTGRAITSCVVVDVGSKQRLMEQNLGNAEARKGFKLRDNEHGLFKALLGALRKKGEQAPSELGLPLGTRVVRAMHFNAEFAAETTIGLASDGDPAAEKRRKDAIRQRITTAGESLKRVGVIDTRKIQIGDLSPTFMWWSGKAIRGYPETYERVQSASASGSDTEKPRARRDHNEIGDEEIPF